MRSLRQLLVLSVLAASILGAIALGTWVWMRSSGALESVLGPETARHPITGLLVALGTFWAIRLVPDLLRLATPGRGGLGRALEDLVPARPLPLGLFALRAACFVTVVGLATHDLVRQFTGA